METAENRKSPRIYVDADVELRAGDVRALVAALGQPGVLAAAPRRELVMTGRPWQVRWYYDIWTLLPAVQRGMHIRVEEASKVDVGDPKVRAVLFGQRAS